jgi:hypothetical protein
MEECKAINVLTDEDDEVIDNFCCKDADENPSISLEGEVYLKTKSGTMKKHWAMIKEKELYFYKEKGDEVCKLMHCLIGTYISDEQEKVFKSG